MRYKIVNDWKAKDIILTAESLLDLRREIEDSFAGDQKKGAMEILRFLEDSYRKIE